MWCLAWIGFHHLFCRHPFSLIQKAFRTKCPLVLLQSDNFMNTHGEPTNPPKGAPKTIDYSKGFALFLRPNNWVFSSPPNSPRPLFRDVAFRIVRVQKWTGRPRDFFVRHSDPWGSHLPVLRLQAATRLKHHCNPALVVVTYSCTSNCTHRNICIVWRNQIFYVYTGPAAHHHYESLSHFREARHVAM